MRRLCFGVVLAAMVSLVVGCGPSAPDVTGMPLVSATAKLESAGLRVGEIAYDTGASAATGTVVAQTPPAGTRADSGSSVTLTVAGAAPVAMPDLVGMDAGSASAAVAAAGLSLGQQTKRHSESIDAGRVVSQTPPAGSVAPPGSTVALVISSGAESVRVPNVKGRTESRAKERLKAAGFKVKVARARSSKPQGTVIAQKPGGRAAAGKTITITVSAGGSGSATGDSSGQTSGGSRDAAAQAFADHKSGVQISGKGTVTRVLSDDTNGSRHQRFILRLASGQTLLIAHNIDIAPRVPSLSPGDVVSFSGVYEWNAEGGTVHWTHHDPDGDHAAGWLKHGGSTYQ